MQDCCSKFFDPFLFGQKNISNSQQLGSLAYFALETMVRVALRFLAVNCIFLVTPTCAPIWLYKIVVQSFLTRVYLTEKYFKFTTAWEPSLFRFGDNGTCCVAFSSGKFTNSCTNLVVQDCCSKFFDQCLFDRKIFQIHNSSGA